MIRRLALLAVCGCASLLPAAERLPADCRWSVQLDATTIAACPLGGWLKAQVAQAPWAARLKLLELATGFSPLRDLRAVTVCGSDASEAGRLLLLRGAFDPARLATLAAALPGHASETAYGRSLHSWGDGAPRWAACLAEPDLLIIGPSVERVRTAIAAHGRTVDDGRAVGPVLATLTASDLSAWADDDLRSSPFGAISRLELRVGTLGDALELTADATARDAGSAQAIVDLGAQLVAAGHGQPVLDEALRSAHLVGDGERISFHMLLPADGLQRLIATGAAPAPAGTVLAVPPSPF